MKSYHDDIPDFVARQIDISIKYDGYIKRQFEQVEKMKSLENKLIPAGTDYLALKGLSRESQLKLAKVRPASIGQASRIAGVNPADISVLLVHLWAGTKK